MVPRADHQLQFSLLRRRCRKCALKKESSVANPEGIHDLSSMAKCEPLDYAAEAETQGASERNIVVVRSPICYGQKGGAGKEGVKEEGVKDKPCSPQCPKVHFSLAR